MLAAAGAMIASAAGAMNFTIHDPCGGGNASYCGMRILGVGPIQQGDAQVLRTEIAKWRREYGGFSGITLHSPGGSVMAGMELGREIRRQRLDAFAPSEFSAWVFDGVGRKEYRLVPKLQCHSACVYALLGGVRREVEPGAIVGVHQFSTPTPGAAVESSAQALMVLLRAYVEEMGVAPAFLDLASLVRPNEIHVLTACQLTALKVDNTKGQHERWTIRATDSGKPFVTGKTTLPDGRVVTLALGATPDGLVAVTSIMMARAAVRPDRLANFPVNEHPKLFIDLGEKGTWEGAPAREWKRRDLPEGYIFESVAMFDQRFASALVNSTKFSISDGWAGSAIQDVALVSTMFTVEGLAEGMRLVNRSR